MGYFITTIALLSVLMITILVIGVEYENNSVDTFIVGLIYCALSIVYSACTANDLLVEFTYMAMIFALLLLNRLSLKGSDEHLMFKLAAMLGVECLILVMTDFKIAFTVALSICIVSNVRRWLKSGINTM